jgi:transposase
MAKPLSPDLRLRIIRAVEDEGMSCRGAAGRFGVAPSTAIELVNEWRSTGACEAGAQGGDRRSARIEGHAAEILSLVEATPDMTLAEIADHLFKAHGERFVPSVIWRFFDRRNITFKKTSHASEQDRPDVAAERAAWKASQPEIDIHRLVFIDETGASTKMARLYGRSPYGQRCVAALPHGHWKTTTFVGALRATGMTAPMVLDGPMDGSGVRGLRDASPRADTRARRHRGDGQSRSTQAGRGRHRNRSGGRPAPLSAALFARPQSDRNGHRQAQSRPSKGGRQINRGLGRRYRRHPCRLHRPRVSQLLRRSRL